MTPIEDEIVDFATKLLQQGFDYIVGIERKGLEFLACAQELLGGSPADWPEIVASGPARAVGRRLFTGKRVLVFDDSIIQGNMLRWTTGQLAKFTPDVTSAAFMVSEECPSVNYPDILHAVYDLEEYPYKRRELVSFLLSAVRTPPSSRLVFSFRVPPGEREALVAALRSLGTVYRVPAMSGTHESDMLTLFASSFCPPIQAGFPPGAYLDELCKLRFRVENDGTVFCAPQASPILPFNFSYPIHRWPEGAWCCLTAQLTEAGEESWTPADWFEHLGLYASLVLAETFAQALLQTSLAAHEGVQFLGVDSRILSYFYPLAWRAVQELAQARLRQHFERGPQCVLPLRWDASDGDRILMVESQDHALKLMHRAIRVGVEVFDGWCEIRAQKGGMEHLVDHDGLTFRQLRHRLRHWIDDVQTSQLLDVLLDQSVLIPLHSVSSPLGPTPEPRELAVLYRPAGEYVLQQLEGTSLALRSIRRSSRFN
jgi:hypothetical protein